MLGVARAMQRRAVEEPPMPRTVLLVLLAGCSEASMVGDMGVAPGGSQDIGYARDLIEAGQIPDQEHFTAEGLFNEHDLPLSGDVCDAILCPRAAATVHHPYTGDPSVLVQLGFGTSIEAATFLRPDLDLVFVVDVSGSMTGEPLDLAKAAMLRAIDQLDADDHASLVVYGSRARVAERARIMDADGRARLIDAVNALEPDGSTDMESGMQLGYDQLDPALDASHRMMIFSDAQPNTGVTEESGFVELVREHAAEGVGLTFIGVSPTLGTELANAIGKVRGGNFYFLDEENLPTLFGDAFAFMVSPIAYDLEVAVTPAEGVALGAVYGAPVDGGEVRMGAATLFLSSEDGGIAATFAVAPTGPMAVASMAVSYLPVDATTREAGTIEVAWAGGAYAGEADDLGVAKIDGLVTQFDAMMAAADACDGGDFDAAAAQVDAASAALSASAVALEQPDLEVEAALMTKLAANLRAPSCAPADSYGY